MNPPVPPGMALILPTPSGELPLVIERLPKVSVLPLLAGLPAVLAAVLGAFLILGQGRPIAASVYKEEAERRLRQNDLRGALDCYKRLLDQNPNQPELKYWMALILEKTGQVDRAGAMIESLAPTDRTGFPIAHLWVANHIIANPMQLTMARAQQAEGHLLRYLQVDRNSSEAKGLLGILFAGTKRSAEARPLLEQVAGQNPIYLLELSKVCSALGDSQYARSNAAKSLEAFRKQSEDRPDDRNIRVLWAEAAVFLEDYDQAIEILTKGVTLNPDPMYLKNMGQVCSTWGFALEKEGQGQLAKRLSVLQRGLGYDPENGRLLAQMNSILTSPGKESEEGRQFLRDSLAKGKVPAGVVHFVLGNAAWSRGDVAEARSHWELACKIESRLPSVVNNLAWLLANREPTDFPRALLLIDQAITVTPADPRLHGTRGQVLEKMGRWGDAVPEMETAIAGGDNSPELHKALASAYDHMGMPQMAAPHRPPPPAR